LGLDIVATDDILGGMFNQDFNVYRCASIIFWAAFIYAVFFNISGIEADKQCRKKGWGDSILNWYMKSYCVRNTKLGIEKIPLSQIRGNNGY